MNKQQVEKAIAELKKGTKRKFSQSYDLIINLKAINPKADSVNLFISLPHPKPTKPKIAIFSGPELKDQAEKVCDLVLTESDFSKYSDAKLIKKLAQEYDYFIAQANLMAKVAQIFGKVLGTKGKMPNPKLGCVVPPNANLGPLVKKLQGTVKLSSNRATNLQCMIGKEDQSEDHIVENAMAVYTATVKQLPQENQNIKNVQIKLTMGKPIKIQ